MKAMAKDEGVLATKKKITALRITNIVISMAMAAISIGYILYILITQNDPQNRLVATMATLFGCFLPYIIEFIVRRKFSDCILLIYFGFLMFAGLIGAVFCVYEYVVGFDKAIHFMFGYLGSLLGLFIVCLLADYKKMHPALVALVCFAFAMAGGAIWEVFEYVADTFLHQTSQGEKLVEEGGRMVATITDSMLDLVCSTVGSFVFIIHYIVHRCTKKSLLIGYLVKDFSAARTVKDECSQKEEA